MLKSIRQWVSRIKTSRKEKEEILMDKSVNTMTKQKISSEFFNRCVNDVEIKRIGKQLVIMDQNDRIPVSKQSIMNLKSTIERKNIDVKISTNGLSRAQVGRIVGNLKENSNMGVYVRKRPAKRSTVRRNRNSVMRCVQPQLMNYEILVTGGNDDE